MPSKVIAVVNFSNLKLTSERNWALNPTTTKNYRKNLYRWYRLSQGRYACFFSFIRASSNIFSGEVGMVPMLPSKIILTIS
jgi:hypothetical protein